MVEQTKTLYQEGLFLIKERLLSERSSVELFWSMNILDLIWIIRKTQLMLSYIAEKVSVFGVILVHNFPVFSLIRTKYGEILRVSLYSLRTRENAGKMRNRITPNTSAFYAVLELKNVEHTCQILAGIWNGMVIDLTGTQLMWNLP